MNPLLADLLQVLRLERLEKDLFRGESRDPGSRRVFGGQVLGQALAAAYGTIEQRTVHSLHAYFLRAGDPDHRIVYDVDRSRDGVSFSSRRVVAIQHGGQIFHMSASFQRPAPGADRQCAMPSVPPPDDLPDMAAAVAELERLAPDRPRPFVPAHPAFDFRPAIIPDPTTAGPGDMRMSLWFRTSDALPDDPVVHQCLLAYASDYYLLTTASLDQQVGGSMLELQLASIDHAMWFHRPVRIDEWLLYSLDSPATVGWRGLARGTIFSRDGRLVASTAQEGLIRRRPARHTP